MDICPECKTETLRIVSAEDRGWHATCQNCDQDFVIWNLNEPGKLTTIERVEDEIDNG